MRVSISILVPYVRLVHFQGWTRSENHFSKTSSEMSFVRLVHFQGCKRRGILFGKTQLEILWKIIHSQGPSKPSLLDMGKHTSSEMTALYCMILPILHYRKPFWQYQYGCIGATVEWKKIEILSASLDMCVQLGMFSGKQQQTWIK